MQLRKGQDLFFISVGHSAQVMNWQLERFKSCVDASQKAQVQCGSGSAHWSSTDGQPFCPGLGKGDEGRSHAGLLVPMLKELQQDVSSALSPIKSRAVCGDADPVKSGTCGWVVAMPALVQSAGDV